MRQSRFRTIPEHEVPTPPTLSDLQEQPQQYDVVRASGAPDPIQVNATGIRVAIALALPDYPVFREYEAWHHQSEHAERFLVCIWPEQVWTERFGRDNLQLSQWCLEFMQHPLPTFCHVYYTMEEASSLSPQLTSAFIQTYTVMHLTIRL